MEAQRILRLEKGHLIVGQDTDGLTKAFSAGLDWAVKLDKDDFAGKPELAWQHERGDGSRLVGLQPVDGQIVPPEASQIITPRGEIAGRITSSRMSPTLGRSICLGQVDATLAAPGTELTVRLPDGRDVTARVTAHLAHVDPDGLRQQVDSQASGLRPHAAPVARSPIASGDLSDHHRGLGGRRRGTAGAALTIADHTPLAKIGVRGRPDGVLATALGVRFGRAARDSNGSLVVGSGPGEWLVLGEPGSQDKLLPRTRTLADETGEFGTVIDLTHGRAMIRLTGRDCAGLLAKVCGDRAVRRGRPRRRGAAHLGRRISSPTWSASTGMACPATCCTASAHPASTSSTPCSTPAGEFGIEIDGCPISPVL